MPMADWPNFSLSRIKPCDLHAGSHVVECCILAGKTSRNCVWQAVIGRFHPCQWVLESTLLTRSESLSTAMALGKEEGSKQLDRPHSWNWRFQLTFSDGKRRNPPRKCYALDTLNPFLSKEATVRLWQQVCLDCRLEFTTTTIVCNVCDQENSWHQSSFAANETAAGIARKVSCDKVKLTCGEYKLMFACPLNA